MEEGQELLKKTKIAEVVFDALCAQEVNPSMTIRLVWVFGGFDGC